MGYLCPVCEEPQVDAEHLANHLAFTAILRSGEHEDWLDENAPGWTDEAPETLGPIVSEHAADVELDIPDDEEFPEDRTMAPPRQVQFDQDGLSARDREILEEAREMTREMIDGSNDAALDDEE
jgi:hypothetical protein